MHEVPRGDNRQQPRTARGYMARSIRLLSRAVEILKNYADVLERDPKALPDKEVFDAMALGMRDVANAGIVSVDKENRPLQLSLLDIANSNESKELAAYQKQLLRYKLSREVEVEHPAPPAPSTAIDTINAILRRVKILEEKYRV